MMDIENWRDYQFESERQFMIYLALGWARGVAAFRASGNVRSRIVAAHDELVARGVPERIYAMSDETLRATLKRWEKLEYEAIAKELFE